MIHFKIISANDLPSSSKNKYCSSYVILCLQNFDLPSNVCYAKTETIKKTPNPEWNQEFIIPFVACNAIRLEFWESKAFGDQIIGTSYIYFQSDLFYQDLNSRVQTGSIILDKPSAECHPTFTYSISSSFSSFDVKPAKKTDNIYVYLSYEPPIQPSQQEDVQLNVYGVNGNGTTVDPISDLYTRGESEPTHCGPTGPTQVFYFNFFNNLVNEKYFFFIKNNGYSGRVTLNFVTTPNYFLAKKNTDGCYIFNNQWSVYVNNKNTGNHCYATFPIMLSFSDKRGIISPITLPQNIIHQSVSNQTVNHSNNPDMFNAAYEYYHNDPDGVAVKNITDVIGQFLCPHGQNFHYRFEIVPGNRYSLSGAFDYNNINQHPSKIMVGLGWDTNTDLDASILMVCDDGKQLMPVCFYNRSSCNGAIKTTGDNMTGFGRGDDERIYLQLDKIPQNIKYLGIVITSYRGAYFSSINGAFCRIVDQVTEKEVMYMNLSKKEKHTGLLFAVMARLDGIWDMWPCLKYFDGRAPEDAQKFFESFMKSGIIDQMLSI
ncbi:hypothetical protein M9Y10_007646 [Tritrichomonas musculus]|uniref:C2 domain-containing protein n=1 Tax=Tritrichomonas musculus TaxID=1915356 RepID=A0ABR2J434_9EUKA